MTDVKSHEYCRVVVVVVVFCDVVAPIIAKKTNKHTPQMLHETNDGMASKMEAGMILFFYEGWVSFEGVAKVKMVFYYFILFPLFPSF